MSQESGRAATLAGVPLVHGGRKVAVGPGAGGRGVIALEAIAAGEHFDTACVLVLSKEEVLPGRTLDNYVYLWSEAPHERYALAFGLGSLYNHSPRANAGFTLDREGKCIRYHALAPIQPGDEVCIHYDYDQAHLDNNPGMSWYVAG